MASGDDGAASLSRSAIFVQVLLLHLAVRETIRFLEGEGDVRLFWAAGFALCLAASFAPAARRAAVGLALALATTKLVLVFPHSSNHFLLEYLCLVFASLVCWRRDEDAAVFLCGVRWLPVLVLLWSGVNKMVYGTYWNGAFLATQLPKAGFASVFGLLLSDAELARLLATEPPGPYHFTGWPALLASNAVWLGEIVCGVALLVPRLRLLGLLASVALLMGIELGAFEVMFGTLMLNMLTLFAPPVWTPPVAVASAAFYASLVAAKLGWLPMWSFN